MARPVTIEDLLPHRATMLLIDTIVRVAEDAAETQATVAPDWPLVQGAGVNPIILIELAAQTAGIYFGWHTMQTAPRCAMPVSLAPQGWLAGVKRAYFRVESIALQSCITTQSRIVTAIQDYKEVKATCQVDDTLIGEIHLQVLQANKKTSPPKGERLGKGEE